MNIKLLTENHLEFLSLKESCTGMSESIHSKKEGKDQELIQSSTTPDPGYQRESDNVSKCHIVGNHMLLLR